MELQCRKRERTLKPRCKCDEDSFTECIQINDRNREEIFTQFWSPHLQWPEKRMFVCQNVTVSDIARPRHRKNVESSRRNSTFGYFFEIDGRRRHVCKTFFLNTLCLTDWCVITWKKQQIANRVSPTNSKIRTPNEAVRSSNLEKREHLKNFLFSLSQMESHYCRKTLREERTFLEPLWNSKADLYQFYTRKCEEDKVRPLSLHIFLNVMSDCKISIFKRKKDECETCLAYKEKNGITGEAYKEHLLMKEQARIAKDNDKKDVNCFAFTADVQSVLLAPSNNSSLMYYKSKLKVHNFTLFDLQSNDGYCYLWHECKGDLSANVFSTLYNRFISDVVLPKLKNRRLVFFTDGCGYQNRNSNLSNALMNAALQHDIVIEHKYLQVGHTQMECDSMHSTIERVLRGKDINVPADYVNIIKTARKRQPYIVNYLDHTNFKNFDSIKNLKSIRPGLSTVNTIRALKYDGFTGTLHYKLKHAEDYTLLPSRSSTETLQFKPFDELPDLFTERLPITCEKFKHLQDLKPVILSDHHSFYDNLPKKAAKKNQKSD